MTTHNIFTAPSYCQYADGACDQELPTGVQHRAFFFYPSEPRQIAATIEKAVEILKRHAGAASWKTWRDLKIQGQVIFCEICKASRQSATIVADVTTLNFNLLFEIGYTLGLGIPVIPIRDTTYLADLKSFQDLGILDTLGYSDFTNASQLVSHLQDALPGTALPIIPEKINRDTPLYVLKGSIDTEGTIQLMTTLKKSALRFRAYDPKESPRLSLPDARRQVSRSVGVVAHLYSPNRRGALEHNALCALLCGMATAQQKVVVMLQEEIVSQPIDYRDIVMAYREPGQISALLEPPIRRIVQRLQEDLPPADRQVQRLIADVDLGDPAAENEIGGLKSYFVRTGQYSTAKRGHARLIVGRKGAGKSAIFYGIRDSLGKGHSILILDLKPEGHQFTKLRETVLSKMSAGLQEHTLTAFWNYILLCELSHKILRSEISYSQQDSNRYDMFCKLQRIYDGHNLGNEADFSQRLLFQVERLAGRLEGDGAPILTGKQTELVYGGDIQDLSNAVSEYLEEKEAVWILIDNLDKGWPIRGATPEDILIIRTLLEATRKLQMQLVDRKVDLKCLVLLRTDIWEILVRETPDKGKDTAIRLDWDDPELFREIIRRRIEVSAGLAGSFEDVWRRIFDSHIGTEDAFNYMMARTLMRPRDIIMFLQRAIEVAINRGHTVVAAEDILQAEKGYSEDLLLNACYEIGDTYPGFRDVLYAFEGMESVLSKDDVELILDDAGVSAVEIQKVSELLLWFGFLGTTASGSEGETYSYMVNYNIRRLLDAIGRKAASYVVHPGFRAALSMSTPR